MENYNRSLANIFWGLQSVCESYQARKKREERGKEREKEKERKRKEKKEEIIKQLFGEFFEV